MYLPALALGEDDVIVIGLCALDERDAGRIFPVPHRLLEQRLVCPCSATSNEYDRGRGGQWHSNHKSTMSSKTKVLHVKITMTIPRRHENSGTNLIGWTLYLLAVGEGEKVIKFQHGENEKYPAKLCGG